MKDRRCPSLAHSVTPLGVSFRGIAAVGLSRLCWRSGATLLSRRTRGLPLCPLDRLGHTVEKRAGYATGVRSQDLTHVSPRPKADVGLPAPRL